MILSSKTIKPPSVKKETISIPGADGELDFTEFFGEAKYSNRDLEFNFSIIGANQLSTYSDIKNKIHGQKMNIVLDEDSGFYYYGRISVGDFKQTKNIGKVTITCDCDPWKCKNTETTVTKAITTSGTVALSNLRRSVSPKITTTAAITIAWGSNSASISAGTDLIVPELILSAGSTTLTITGTATVTFKYREGCF